MHCGVALVISNIMKMDSLFHVFFCVRAGPNRKSNWNKETQMIFEKIDCICTRMSVDPTFVLQCVAMGMSAWRRNAETKTCGFDLDDVSLTNADGNLFLH